LLKQRLRPLQIESQNIDSTAMSNACRELAREETNTEETPQITLDQSLQRFLEYDRLSGELSAAPLRWLKSVTSLTARAARLRSR
jgi:hypothetical protein